MGCRHEGGGFAGQNIRRLYGMQGISNGKVEL